MLITGISLMAAGVLLMAVTLLLCRNPHSPRWLVDDVVPLLVLPLLVGLFWIGAIAIVVYGVNLISQPVNLREVAAAAGVAAALPVALRLLGIRRRLAAYAASDGAGNAAAPASVS